MADTGVRHRTLEAAGREGFSGGRMLVARGLLVSAFTVCRLLIDDDAIELIGIVFDLDP